MNAGDKPGPTPDASWRPTCLCIDADGVLHRGKNVLVGTTRLLAELERRAIPFRIVTNNSRETPAESAAHYRALGMDVAGEVVFTAAEALAAYVRAQSPNRPPRVYPLGERSLQILLRAHGCRLVRRGAEYVAVGLDRQLTYGRLARAADEARAGARLIAANYDPTVPNELGAIPGCGAIVAAVEVASGKKATVVGKPEPAMFALAVASMGRQAEECLHLGDRLDTDVLGAARAGLRSALVLTGSHQREDIPAAIVPPDFVFADLEEFLAWFLG